MPDKASNHIKLDYDQHARTKAPDDFWGQVLRTVKGNPVSEEDIQMIVGEIKRRLSLQPDDVLLDLACGNGALTRYLFDSCSESLGVDLSGYLISIANRNFARSPRYTFSVQGAAEYVRSETRPERFTKVVCYGSFAYFSAADAAEVLGLLCKRFVNVRTVFIGNLPDRDRKDVFYSMRKPDEAELADHQSQIGIWRSREEFAQLAQDAGWNVQFSSMPDSFYAAGYRYDAILHPGKRHQKIKTGVKKSVNDLAIFGGRGLFDTPKSTSNLLRPDIEKFLGYSRAFFDKQQYTNNGPNVQLLEKRLAAFHQTEHCVTFCSGFWAIASAISVLAIKDKSEIVMPSLTYRRMPDIVAWLNLKPHFCEVEAATLGMSPATVAPCINENTALILGTHPIVNCCDVNGLVELSRQKKIPLLFDSVESVYESTESGRIGGFGSAEAFSLHVCKLFNGFGGGYVTTNDSALARQLSLMRGFGFETFDHIAVSGGFNGKLNEIHAAMALASLDEVDEQVERNRQRYYTYKRLLSGVRGIRLVEFDERYRAGYKNIVVELLDEWPLDRAKTISVLNAEKILARVYYAPPLHRKPMEFAFVPANLPLTDKLSERFVNLPCGHLVSNEDISGIVEMLEFISENATQISERLLEIERSK